MGIVKVDLYDKSGRLRQIQEGWFIYAAFCVPSNGTAQVKIGISTKVYDRLVALRTGCPFPIEVALFAPAGNRSTASRIEKALHHEFAERNSSGEWFTFDTTSPADKAHFHSITKAVYKFEANRDLVWKKITAEQITAYASLRTREKREGY